MAHAATHGLGRAINYQRLGERFGSALQKGWSAATCWEDCRADYPVDGSNPAFGNCLVSVLAAWADSGYEGEIVPCLTYSRGAAKPGWHFQLVRDGEIIDPTAQQFPPGTKITQLEPGDRMYAEVVRGSFFDPVAERSLRDRLTRLIGGIIVDGGYEMDASADFIVGQIQAHFRPFLPPVDAAPAPRP